MRIRKKIEKVKPEYYVGVFNNELKRGQVIDETLF